MAALLVPAAALAQSPVGGGSGETAGAPPAGTPAPAATVTTTTTSPTDDYSITDVAEKEHKTYYFVGLRYRGTGIPQFMVNLFIGEGATFYSNTVGIEFDVRKDRFSLIPALNYVEYGFDPVLFLDKNASGGAGNAGSWSAIHSNLFGIYATLDMLWSVPIHKHIDFEFGLGIGVGGIFGNIYTNWVYSDPNGPYVSSGNGKFSPCPSAGFAAGCNNSDHNQKATDTPKVPDAQGKPYAEKKWFDGGSVPNVFLDLRLPILGLRIKPIKQLEMRVNTGFSLTGFFFTLSGDFGFEHRETPAPVPATK